MHLNGAANLPPYLRLQVSDLMRAAAMPFCCRNLNLNQAV